ncbi:MAG: hypothetical protein HYX67_12705, partial [Candidatus Melainabacteria bacterium]|nr:hypothetical protein [Candidatus Melainabacteria bacterium]
HDGGSKSDGVKSDGSRAGRTDGADRGTERTPAGDKGLGDRVSSDKGLGDKGHTDVGAGGKVVGSRGDGPFVLPPGSLPVPDLVGGIKNIGQQIDGRTGRTITGDDKGIRQPDKVDGAKIDGTKVDATKVDSSKTDATKGDANKLDPGKGIAAKTEITKADPNKSDSVKIDTKGFPGDGVKTIVTGGLRPGDKTTVPGEGKVGEGVKPTGVDGIKTAATDGVRTIVTGGVAAGDGVKNAVTGGAKGVDGVKVVGAGEAAADGKQLAGKNPAGTKSDGAIIVPPSAVPLTEMIGNLKGIAARIFPPESRTGRPDAFDNSLPGRKTERLEDRTQSTLGAGVRAESTIPIVRAIGERIGKTDEQFVIKAPQSALDASKANQSKIDAAVALPPWIAPEHAVQDKSLPGLKAFDASAAKPADARSIKSDVQPHIAKSGDHQAPHADAHDQVVHDEAAERLLVNFELVGSPESAPAVESEEEEVFPLAAIEYFGEDFERAISGEEDVMFDGDGTVVEDDEQSTRYQYIVEAGDTVELIAIKVFKNVTLAPLIYEINKDAIPIGMQDGRMVFTLKVGTVIWLPFPKEVKAYIGS